MLASERLYYSRSYRVTGKEGGGNYYFLYRVPLTPVTVAVDVALDVTTTAIELGGAVVGVPLLLSLIMIDQMF